MVLEKALHAVVESLKMDDLVEAIFLKGSMARKEHDNYSDIDLYCLVSDENVEPFLPHRIKHLESYKKLLFVDDIYIIAPQILAVYVDLVHIDLFTVMLENIIAKDKIEILYDPNSLLSSVQQKSNLTLESQEFQDAVDDTIWYLYQYVMSRERGNHLWCVHLLHHVMTHMAKVLLHHYMPGRAQLGLKTIQSSLPSPLVHEWESIVNKAGIHSHPSASKDIVCLIQREETWIFEHIPEPSKIKPLWDAIKKLI